MITLGKQKMQMTLPLGMLLVALCASVSGMVQARDHDDDTVIECASHDYAPQRCKIPWRDARLVHQLSNTPCVRDNNWGVDQDEVWVNGGCAARFAIADDEDEDEDTDRETDDRHERREGDRDHEQPRDDQDPDVREPGSEGNQLFSVNCASRDGGDRFCEVDLGGAGVAHLEQQLSRTACVEGSTWGFNRAGIWVTGGCRAVFTIDRRWR